MSLDRVGDLLGPLLEQIGINRIDALATITAGWEDLAGDPWAETTRPAALRHGELLLDVRDAASASILRYRTGELQERLNSAIGDKTIETIRLRVDRSAWPDST